MMRSEEEIISSPDELIFHRKNDRANISECILRVFALRSVSFYGTSYDCII